MTDYYDYGVTLSEGQMKKIFTAHNKGTGFVIKLKKENLHGTHKLPLTQTQINRIKTAKTGMQLKLSESQLKHMEKTGGFLPLAALIPIIAGALGAAGGLTGGIASAVTAARSNAEQARHHRAIEEMNLVELNKASAATGSGIVSDVVGKIPLLGSFLAPLLQKIGLGIKDAKQLNKCECELKKSGYGLYLGPPRHEGTGVFLGPPPLN